MIALIEDNREAIAELCERFGVRRLAVFGSACSDETRSNGYAVDGAFRRSVAIRTAAVSSRTKPVATNVARNPTPAASPDPASGPMKPPSELAVAISP